MQLRTCGRHLHGNLDSRSHNTQPKLRRSRHAKKAINTVQLVGTISRSLWRAQSPDQKQTLARHARASPKRDGAILTQMGRSRYDCTIVSADRRYASNKIFNGPKMLPSVGGLGPAGSTRGQAKAAVRAPAEHRDYLAPSIPQARLLVSGPGVRPRRLGGQEPGSTKRRKIPTWLRAFPWKAVTLKPPRRRVNECNRFYASKLRESVSHCF